jgi:hypothetical protein
VSKIDAWWKDREDERLDEIVGRDYRNARSSADEPGMMAYQLVRSARNSRKDA